MKKYIVSLVLAKLIPGAARIDDGKLREGSPDVSLHNEVSVLQAMDAQGAYDKCAKLAMEKHPGHMIKVRVVMEMAEALENIS